MYARASRNVVRAHATRGVSAALLALALFHFGWIHAERDTIRATRSLLNARNFCEETSTRELEAWNFHKKLLSFSLFAPSNEGEEVDFPWFLNGIVQNAKDATLYYPDWIVRVYVIGIDVKAERTLETQQNLELVRCTSSLPLNSSSSRKMLTRFLVYDDPKVRLAIVRDTDSRCHISCSRGPDVDRSAFVGCTVALKQAQRGWYTHGLLQNFLRRFSSHADVLQTPTLARPRNKKVSFDLPRNYLRAGRSRSGNARHLRSQA